MSSMQAKRRMEVLWRLFSVVALLGLIGIGLSCIRQQDEVLVQPEEPETTQQTEQQK